jgi:peptidyl-prolyl cis-trans isomerase B (cyclophilin B)
MALCSNCGHEKGAGSYCGGCGQRSSSGITPPQYQPPQYQQPQYQQPQYQPPHYQQQYGVPQFVPVSNKTNSMAISAFVVSLICCAPLGVIFGHVALSQINRSGEGGRGLAIAGLVIGYAACAVGLLALMSVSGGSGY